MHTLIFKRTYLRKLCVYWGSTNAIQSLRFSSNFSEIIQNLPVHEGERQNGDAKPRSNENNRPDRYEDSQPCKQKEVLKSIASR